MTSLIERVNLEIGAHIYTCREPAIACTNLWQIRGWLDAANEAWMKDHESVLAQVEQDVNAAQGKCRGCTGRCEVSTGQTVITVAAVAEFDEYLEEQSACTTTEDIGRYEFEHRFMW